MKTLIATMMLSIWCSVSQAALWTFHSCEDNAPIATFSSSSQHWQMMWDLDYDLAYPDYKDSGVYHANIGSYWDWSIIGYGDVYVLDLPEDVWLVRIEMFGPYPDYDGWEGHLYWPGGHAWNGQVIAPSMTTNSPTAGEYWIDYDSTGMARMSMIQHGDFGKWAWDGSINPSWVGP